MNFITPTLACAIRLNGGQIALLLFFFAGWWTSAALAIVNPFLLGFLSVPRSFKKLHFAIWAGYVVPGVLLVLGLYDHINATAVPSWAWITYMIVIPFVTVTHFAFLFRTRRKLRLGNPEVQEGNK
jgi:hypothetical protein